jgi:hypothetical protein
MEGGNGGRRARGRTGETNCLHSHVLVLSRLRLTCALVCMVFPKVPSFLRGRVARGRCGPSVKIQLDTRHLASTAASGINNTHGHSHPCHGNNGQSNGPNHGPASPRTPGGGKATKVRTTITASDSVIIVI